MTKKIIYSAVLVIGLGLTMLSCKKDDSQDRDKFLGTYSVAESCSIIGMDNYEITITESGYRHFPPLFEKIVFSILGSK